MKDYEALNSNSGYRTGRKNLLEKYLEGRAERIY